MPDILLLLKPEKQKSSLAQLMLTQQADVHCCVLPPLASLRRAIGCRWQGAKNKFPILRPVLHQPQQSWEQHDGTNSPRAVITGVVRMEILSTSLTFLPRQQTSRRRANCADSMSTKYLWHVVSLRFLMFSKYTAGAEMWFVHHWKWFTYLLCWQILGLRNSNLFTHLC